MNISRVLYSDARSAYEVTYTPDIVFAHRETGDLALQLLSPVAPDIPKPQNHAIYAKINQERKWHEQPKDTRVFPLIVDVPGSGWSGAEGYAHVPKMVELAKQGFVVACIAYRGTFKDNVRFPAAVQDTKEAIRFLRANAAIYHIDPEHVTLLGDSSGGHTVAMAALTGEESRFNIGEHLDQNTKVNACVIFYGPNDLLNLVTDRLTEGKKLRPGEGEYPFEAREIFQEDFLVNPQMILADASPINYIHAEEKLPAFLFLQGEDDPIIPMAQGLRFCDKVRSCGGRAEFIKIAAGGHGTGCWTPEAMQLVAQFLKAYN
ncbi:MAG: alpha/beta hydrolase fold domain-containing protein [Suilimivivens sp.]